MHYKLTFCFPKYPKIILAAFVTTENENDAKEKFKNDYPNFVGCEILQVNPYED